MRKLEYIVSIVVLYLEQADTASSSDVVVVSASAAEAVKCRRLLPSPSPHCGSAEAGQALPSALGPTWQCVLPATRVRHYPFSYLTLFLLSPGPSLHLHIILLSHNLVRILHPIHPRSQFRSWRLEREEFLSD